MFAQVPEHEINVWNDVLITKEGSPKQSSYCYPILTAPLAGKSGDEMVCPGSHRALAREFLAQCDKFLVIGSSGSDDDLLELLDAALEPRLTYAMHFVGWQDEAEESLGQLPQGVRGFTRGDPTWSKMCRNGFRQYVSSEGILEFARRSL